MNANGDVDENMPCARGCAWQPAVEGEPERPKPARHGMLCDSCFYRLKHALDLIPDLMGNMRAMIFPGGTAAGTTEPIRGGRDGSPAPIRIDPLDASDSLYAKLVSWTEVFSAELHTPQPSVAVWINFKEVQGSRPVTPETAREIASQLVHWFLIRLDDITASESQAVAFHDDLCYGWEYARGVFSLAASYGVEARPIRPADKRECPICGRQEVFVKMPDKLDPDIAVICGRCKWVADPATYAPYASLLAHEG